MRCMRCGDDNPSGAPFCRVCGNPLRPAYYQPRPVAYPDTTQVSIERAILWIVIAVVAMIVIGAVVALLWWNSLLDQISAQMSPGRILLSLAILV